MNKHNTSHQYRPEIDGLRALAVIAVIINHFNKNWLPSGFLGVDIFFVISGYVITCSLINKQYASVQDFLLGFYSRRIKRLIPALVTCIAITCAIGFLFVPPLADEFGSSWRSGIAALFGVSNLYLFNQSNDYFAASTELNLFTQTWSLGVEEQFYLIFPILIWSSGLAQQRQQGRKIFLYLMFFLSSISFLTYLYWQIFSQPAAYFLMPARFWELSAGCIIVLILQGENQFLRLIRSIKSLPILVLIMALLFAPQSAIYQSTPAVVILTSLLIGTLNPGTYVYQIFTKPPVVFIGLISYSLYLWHWSVLAISRWTIGIEWWTVPLQICLMIALAVISNKLIEQPLRYANWSVSRLQTIGYGLSASLLSTGLLAGLGGPLKNLLYIGDPTPFSQASWWRDANGKYIEKCHVETEYSDKLFDECTHQDRQSPQKHNIYIFGDSHARNYFSGIQAAFPEYNVNYITMGSFCTFMPENLISVELETKTRCSNYVKRVREFVDNNLKQGDLVFIGQEKKHQFDLGYANNIIDLAQSTHKNGGHFVLLADVPGLDTDPAVCVKQAWRSQSPVVCEKTLAKVNDEQKVLNKIGYLLETKVPGSIYLDVRSYLCVASICSSYKDGILLYHDKGHITETASKLLSIPIGNKLSSLASKK